MADCQLVTLRHYLSTVATLICVNALVGCAPGCMHPACAPVYVVAAPVGLVKQGAEDAIKEDKKQAAIEADVMGESIFQAEVRDARIERLELRSGRGDVESTIELAELTGNLAPLTALAEKGNPTSAYALYEQLSRKEKSFSVGWRWLCKIANEGDGKAQAEVGYWHRTSVWQYSGDERLNWLPSIGVNPDNRVAYVWYTLADADVADKALTEREFVISDMRDYGITQAEQMLRDWKPGDCPSAEHRLGPPGET